MAAHRRALMVVHWRDGSQIFVNDIQMGIEVMKSLQAGSNALAFDPGVTSITHKPYRSVAPRGCVRSNNVEDDGTTYDRAIGLPS